MLYCSGDRCKVFLVYVFARVYTSFSLVFIPYEAANLPLEMFQTLEKTATGGDGARV